MNLYKIYQDINEQYDTYEGAIVAANSEEEARAIHPSGYIVADWSITWAGQEHVGVILIGQAKENTTPGVILSSLNAG